MKNPLKLLSKRTQVALAKILYMNLNGNAFVSCTQNDGNHQNFQRSNRPVFSPYTACDQLQNSILQSNRLYMSLQVNIS